MTKLFKSITLAALLLFSIQALAAEKVAKVIIKRGQIFAIDSSTKEQIAITKGMWLKEGTILVSRKKSFAKLLFVDQSQLNLGPNSQMVINQFPKEKAGIITLMKGQIRSSVTKDYMKMDKSKSKLFIKTKSAAMGIRGTIFEVTYNPKTEITRLDVLEGLVAFNKLADTTTLSQDMLEQVVSASNAKFVGGEKSSEVRPGEERPTEPKAIPKSDLDKMQKTEVSSQDVAAKPKAKPKAKLIERVKTIVQKKKSNVEKKPNFSKQNSHLPPGVVVGGKFDKLPQGDKLDDFIDEADDGADDFDGEEGNTDGRKPASVSESNPEDKPDSSTPLMGPKLGPAKRSKIANSPDFDGFGGEPSLDELDTDENIPPPTVNVPPPGFDPNQTRKKLKIVIISE